jgi:hypothetical protein
MSGRRALQLVFGARQAPQPLTQHEKDFIAEARPVLDQEARNEYSIAMLWEKLLQKIQKGEILGAAAEWWDTHLPGEVDSRMATKYARVCDHFWRAIFIAYGVTKLNLLLTWAKLNGLRLPKGSPDPGNTPITFVQAGKTISKSFKDCTVADMTKAVHPHVTHPQPGHDKDNDDPKLPEVTRRFLAVANNRLSGYEDEGPSSLVLTAQLVSTDEGDVPHYSLQNVREEYFHDVLQILEGVWKEIEDEAKARHAGLPR